MVGVGGFKSLCLSQNHAVWDLLGGDTTGKGTFYDVDDAERREIEVFLTHVAGSVWRTRICATQTGRLALDPEKTAAGGRVVVFEGCDVAFVLRRDGPHHQLVGHSYFCRREGERHAYDGEGEKEDIGPPLNSTTTGNGTSGISKMLPMTLKALSTSIAAVTAPSLNQQTSKPNEVTVTWENRSTTSAAPLGNDFTHLVYLLTRPSANCQSSKADAAGSLTWRNWRSLRTTLTAWLISSIADHVR